MSRDFWTRTVYIEKLININITLILIKQLYLINYIINNYNTFILLIPVPLEIYKLIILINN